MSVNGCRWCGASEREHGPRLHPDTGYHQWVAPTDQQRIDRIKEGKE